ncbi:MAG: hypothetical protein Q8L86_15335 [Vicinamibacterales bacterium]|nr:hypothetical protein [Vicinamibacterales bacterium]
MPAAAHATLAGLVTGLQRIFGARLRSVVAYGRPQGPDGLQPSLALVDSLTADDLTQCAAHIRDWHGAGAATPLVLPREEFARALDSFPVEFGEILADHAALFGADPFEGLAVSPSDLRRAAEGHARSLLLHVRENCMDCGGRPADIADLVVSAAPGFAALLRLLARLDEAPAATVAELDTFAATRLHLDARTVGDLLHLADGAQGGIDAARLFPALLGTLEALVHHVDHWHTAS